MKFYECARDWEKKGIVDNSKDVGQQTIVYTLSTTQFLVKGIVRLCVEIMKCNGME